MSRTTLVVCLAAGLGLLTACSQPAAVTPSGSAAAPSTSAPATTAASTAPAGASGVDDFIGKLTAGAATVKTYAIDLTVETAIQNTEVSIVSKGVVDQTDKGKTKMSMSMNFGGMEMKMLKIGDDMYMQMGATGKKWTRVPKDQAGSYDSTTDVDYASQLAKVKDSITSIKDVGEETVDGTPAHHYRLTMDADAMGAMAGGTSSGAKLDADNFVYDIWLDDANLTRKVSMDVKLESDGKKMPMKMVTTMGKYNEPVEINAPAKADIQG